MSLMFVRDGRTLPFVPVTCVAMEAIRSVTPKSHDDRPDGEVGTNRAYVTATYVALLEMANDERGTSVDVSQKALGEMVGISRVTIQKALLDLERAGVLEVRRKTHAGGMLENEYVIIEPGVARLHPRSGDDLGVGQEKGSVPLEELQEDVCARERVIKPKGPPPLKVGGRLITQSERTLVKAVLAHFNEKTGKDLRPVTSGGRVTDATRLIVSRARDYPDVPIEKHITIIDATLSQPWWEGAPSINVVYGPKVFEQNISKKIVKLTSGGKVVDEAKEKATAEAREHRLAMEAAAEATKTGAAA